MHYLWKLRPVSKRSSLAFGDAMDAGLNALLETRELGAGTERFESTWYRYKDTDIKYSKSDVDEFLVENVEDNKPWWSLHSKGIILLNEFNNQIMPRIKNVIKVQIDETVPNESGDELVIKTDFICEWEDGRIILFDNKTSSVKYTEDSVRTSPQLSIYYETLKEEYKIDACGYIVIPKRINKLKEPRARIEVIIDNIDQDVIDTTLESYDLALKEIKAANFKPNHKSCIGKYGRCDYHDFCHKGDCSKLEEKK